VLQPTEVELAQLQFDGEPGAKRQHRCSNLRNEKGPTTRRIEMEWIVALVAVMVVPFWIVLWWIPRCDAVGIQKVKEGAAHEPAKYG
jgi:hypothetical protein